MSLHRTSRRSLLQGGAAAAAAVLASPFVRAQSMQPVRFTLDWRFDGPGAMALLPLAKGYFKAENLDVSLDTGNGSAAAVQRIASGTHDIGFADTSALIEYLGNNPGAPPMKAVYMLMERTPASAFALKSSGIRAPADLVGKRLGAPVFDAGRKAFPIFAKANRFDAGKVQWTNADPALRETLLAKGEFDAITGFYYTSLLNLEARGVKADDLVVFQYADHGVNLYGNAVIVSNRFASERPQAVAAFLRALDRGIREVVADPHAAVRFVKEREPILDAAIEERRLRYFLGNFTGGATVQAQGYGRIDEARLRSNVAQIVDASGLKQFPDVKQLFDPAFLPAASGKAG